MNKCEFKICISNENTIKFVQKDLRLVSSRFMVHPPSSAWERDRVWRQVSAKCGRGPASVSHGVSQATVGGGDEAVVARDDREGSVGMAKWGDCWCNNSTWVGGARWWWIGVA